MRRLVALALFALAPVMSTGCGSDGGTEPASSIVGSYALTSVDGTPPPITLMDGVLKVVLVSDEVALAAGGTFTRRIKLDVTEGGVTTREDDVETGSYTVSGSTINFRFGGATTATPGTLSDRTITIVADGSTLVYVRP